MSRIRLATVWLGGCSGCHMSFLDLDEGLIDLAARVELVFSPLADAKTFPPDVDVTLVEGAIANEDNRELALRLRANSRVVVSLGDCAVTGNVTALRNPLGDPLPLLRRVYVDAADGGEAPAPDGVLPALLDEVMPLHALIPVDVFVPGCPPSPGRIRTALEHLLDDRPPREGAYGIRFG